MLLYAAINPLREEEAGQQSQDQERAIVQKLNIIVTQTWSDYARNVIRQLLSAFDLPRVLPDALKNYDDVEIEEFKEIVLDRLQNALRELEGRGLITKSDEDVTGRKVFMRTRFHMHPMAHKWVRERPRMTAAEDGLYCQFAKTVLSSAVKLQGVDSAEEQSMRREMKPHVDHVRQYEMNLQQRITKNQRKNKSKWSMLIILPSAVRPKFGKMQALEHAKFSKVYMESGEFSVAESLLRDVQDFLMSRLGDEHEVSQRVLMALSVSLFHQTRHNEAEVAQRHVYETRKRIIGPGHPRTLEAMRELGYTVLHQGKLTEALELCELAREGLTKAYGPTHRETIMSINQIGKVHFFRMNSDESFHHHELAYHLAEKSRKVDSMPEADYLIVQEDYAMALLKSSNDEDIKQKAVKLQADVVNQRAKLLGESQPYTLIAKANYGKALAAVKRFDEAIDLMSRTLVTAQTLLGEGHLGVLAGKNWFGQVLMEKGDLIQAEDYLRQATHKESYRIASGRDGEYQDRIGAAWVLIDCYERQGKLAEALELSKELEESIPLVGGKGLGKQHKLFGIVKKKVADLETKLRKDASD
jgi:tetratricopeptide (TPR) repeat protein